MPRYVISRASFIYRAPRRKGRIEFVPVQWQGASILAGASGFFVNERILLAAQTAFAAAGSFATDSSIVGHTTWQGQGAFGGTATLAAAVARYNAAGTVFSQPLTGQSSNWQGQTLRQLFAPSLLASVDPGAIGVQFQFAPGTNGSIDAAWIGHAAASGDPYDFDGGQVQLKFGGSNSQAVVGAQNVSSDNISFPLDVTRTLIVAASFSGTQVNLMGYGG